MIATRRPAPLASADHGWLQARLHVAIGSLGDPAHTPFGILRAWNDDTFAPRSGFPMHPHRDLEIITCVRSGAITHADDLGNGGRIEAGDVQVMSAGAGIRHSEHNAEDDPTSLYQIWLAPRTVGSTPRWARRRFPTENHDGRLTTLASGDPRGDALFIDADADLLGATLRTGDTVRQPVGPGRAAYLVAAGAPVLLNGVELAAGDGAAVTDDDITLTALGSTGLVLLLLH